MKTKFFAIIACLIFVFLLCQISYAQYFPSGDIDDSGCYGSGCYGSSYGFGYGFDPSVFSLGDIPSGYGGGYLGPLYGGSNIPNFDYCEATYGPGWIPICFCDDDISTCECQCVFNIE